MKANIVLTSILLMIAVLFFGMSFQYRYEARIAPMLVGILATICLSIELAKSLWQLSRGRTKLEGSSDHIVIGGGGFQMGIKSYLAAAGWMIGLVAGIYLVGMEIAIPIFIVAYMRVYKESWLLSLAVAAVLFVVIWGFFDMALHVTMYRGILLE